jgi:hypothetical protein
MSVLRAELRVELRLEVIEHGIHVPHRAVAEERHRAVRDPSVGLDLRPPDAAMPDTDPIDVQGLGNDHMVDARYREPAALREIMHTAVAARFLIDGARDLERPRKLLAGVDERLHGDDGRGDPALHVAGAAAEDLAVPDDPGEGVHRPAGTGLHHVDVAVEMHAGSARPALAPRDHVDPRMALAVSRRPFRPHVLERESPARQPLPDELGARPIGLARRIDRGKAHELARQLDELFAPRIDRSAERIVGIEGGSGLGAHDGLG